MGVCNGGSGGWWIGNFSGFIYSPYLQHNAHITHYFCYVSAVVLFSIRAIKLSYLEEKYLISQQFFYKDILYAYREYKLGLI